MHCYYRPTKEHSTYSYREGVGDDNGRDNKALDQRPHNKVFPIDSAATFLSRFLLVEGREREKKKLAEKYSQVAVNNQKHPKHTNEDLFRSEISKEFWWHWQRKMSHSFNLELMMLTSNPRSEGSSYHHNKYKKDRAQVTSTSAVLLLTPDSGIKSSYLTLWTFYNPQRK